MRLPMQTRVQYDTRIAMTLFASNSHSIYVNRIEFTLTGLNLLIEFETFGERKFVLIFCFANVRIQLHTANDLELLECSSTVHQCKLQWPSNELIASNFDPNDILPHEIVNAPPIFNEITSLNYFTRISHRHNCERITMLVRVFDSIALNSISGIWPWRYLIIFSPQLFSQLFALISCFWPVNLLFLTLCYHLMLGNINIWTINRNNSVQWISAILISTFDNYFTASLTSSINGMTHNDTNDDRVGQIILSGGVNSNLVNVNSN